MKSSEAKAAARRLRRVASERGFDSLKELANAAGLNTGTFYNVASGDSESTAARKRISIFLAAKIWPDVEPDGVVVDFAEGAEIRGLTVAQTLDLHRRIGPSTMFQLDREKDAGSLFFTKPTQVVLNTANFTVVNGKKKAGAAK